MYTDVDELKFTFVFGSEAYINHMVNMFFFYVYPQHIHFYLVKINHLISSHIQSHNMQSKNSVNYNSVYYVCVVYIVL